jgi:hypothetical protein
VCRLAPSHRMRAIGRAIKPSARDPRMDDPGILPGRQVRLRSDPAAKEIPGVPADVFTEIRVSRIRAGRKDPTSRDRRRF